MTDLFVSLAIGYNPFMCIVVNRALVSLLCLVVALPPGWCCYFMADGCCANDAAKSISDEKKIDAAGDCCCTKHLEQTQPTKTRMPRSPSPVKPCCEAAIVTFADKYKPDLDSFTFAEMLPTSFRFTLVSFVGIGITIAFAPIVSSPRIHVFRCVWLC